MKFFRILFLISEREKGDWRDKKRKRKRDRERREQQK
jgi:hypothetical protein